MATEVTVRIPLVTNAEVSASAAIAWSKISKTGALLTDFANTAAPTALIYRATDQVIPDTTETAMSFSTASYDSDSFFSGGAPTRLTIPTSLDGTYVVRAQVTPPAYTNGSVKIRIYKNGSQIAENYRTIISSSAAGFEVTKLVQAVATDYFEVKVVSIESPAASKTFVGGSASCTFELVRVAVTASTGTGGGGGLTAPLAASNIANGTVDNTEFQYLDGVTSKIQTQFDNSIPAPMLRRAGYAVFPGENNFPIVTGLETIALQGTQANGSTASAVFCNFSTSVSGAAVGFQQSSALHGYWFFQRNIYMYMDIATGPSIAAVRIWAGLTASGTHGNDDNGSTRNYCAFRFSTVAGDTGWRGVVSNGASANQQLTVNLGTVAVSTRYHMRIIISGNGALVTFVVNGVSASIATNIPTGTASPSIQAYNQAALLKSINIGSIYVDADGGDGLGRTGL